MHTQFALVTTMLTAFCLALVFGYLAEKFLKTPALVGYLLAGIAVHTFPGLPNIDVNITQQLSDIGVMLLMFGVGLHFSLTDLMRVKWVAIPGALLQMTSSCAIGFLLAFYIFSWSAAESIVFGLTLSFASTVVVLKALEMRNLTHTINGQISIGWLIVQDVVAVLAMVCLPAISQILMPGPEDVFNAQKMAMDIGKTLMGVVVFVGSMLIFGKRFFPWALRQVALVGSRELFTLSVLVIAIGIAYLASAVFSVSFALGAFIAGMVMRESRYARRAATNTLPLQDTFAVLFFVSVGLMLDYHVFLTQPFKLLTVLFIILFLTTSCSAFLVMVLRWPLETALVVAASLAQIGEFSFILLSQGVSMGMASQETMSLLVAAAIITIALNTLVFEALPKVKFFLVNHSALCRRVAIRVYPGAKEKKTNTTLPIPVDHVVIAGYNDICPALIAVLKKKNIPFVVICPVQDPIADFISDEVPYVIGDYTDPMVLLDAHIARAKVLALTSYDAVRSYRILQKARELNPDLKALVRVHAHEDREFFKHDENTKIISDVLSSSFYMAQRTVRMMYSDQEALRGRTISQLMKELSSIFEDEREQIFERMKKTKTAGAVLIEIHQSRQTKKAEKDQEILAEPIVEVNLSVDPLSQTPETQESNQPEKPIKPAPLIDDFKDEEESEPSSPEKTGKVRQSFKRLKGAFEYFKKR